jgi:hypothetical protein
MKQNTKLLRRKARDKNVEDGSRTNVQLDKGLSAPNIRTPFATQSIETNVETGQNKNVKIPGEMNAALNTEKNATTIPDPSKYRMRKMNVLVERSGVARSIGKSLSRERRFGLITQQRANILMPLTADQ